MSGRTFQALMMLLLSIAVGVLFITRVPRQNDNRIAELEAQLAGYQTALAQLQTPGSSGATSTTLTPTTTLSAEGQSALSQTPDPLGASAGADSAPTLPFPSPTATVDPANLVVGSSAAGAQGNLAPDGSPATSADAGGAAPDSGGSLTGSNYKPGTENSASNAPLAGAAVGGGPITPTPPPASPLPGAAAVVNVTTALQADDSGCAIEPRNSFSSTQTILGIGTFVNMQVNDVIRVRFTYTDASELIFESDFTVTEPGSFCRWYDVVPDSAGWSEGTYTVSYQVNQQPPMTASYSIGNVSAPANNTGTTASTSVEGAGTTNTMGSSGAGEPTQIAPP